jgi:hypothetical protein
MLHSSKADVSQLCSEGFYKHQYAHHGLVVQKAGKSLEELVKEEQVCLKGKGVFYKGCTCIHDGPAELYNL